MISNQELSFFLMKHSKAGIVLTCFLYMEMDF